MSTRTTNGANYRDDDEEYGPELPVRGWGDWRKYRGFLSEQPEGSAEPEQPYSQSLGKVRDVSLLQTQPMLPAMPTSTPHAPVATDDHSRYSKHGEAAMQRFMSSGTSKRTGMPQHQRYTQPPQGSDPQIVEDGNVSSSDLTEMTTMLLMTQPAIAAQYLKHWATQHREDAKRLRRQVDRINAEVADMCETKGRYEERLERMSGWPHYTEAETRSKESLQTSILGLTGDINRFNARIMLLSTEARQHEEAAQRLDKQISEHDEKYEQRHQPERGE